MPANGRVIVGCTHGEEDPDRVVVSYLTAGAALDHGAQVVIGSPARASASPCGATSTRSARSSTRR